MPASTSNAVAKPGEPVAAFATSTDTRAMGLALSRLPCNRGARTCDAETVVAELSRSHTGR